MAAVVMNMSLSYEDYKTLEEQLKDFKKLETTHISMGDDKFYHKAVRLRFGEGLIIEIQGPLVREPSRDG